MSLSDYRCSPRPETNNQGYYVDKRVNYTVERLKKGLLGFREEGTDVIKIKERSLEILLKNLFGIKII